MLVVKYEMNSRNTILPPMPEKKIGESDLMCFGPIIWLIKQSGPVAESAVQDVSRLYLFPPAPP